MTAGCGKTVVSSRVVDDLRLARHSDFDALAFFYCNRNQSDRQDPTSILRSLIRQLSMTDGRTILKPIKEIYHEFRYNARELRLHDCAEVLLALANTYPHTSLVLDGLDECREEERDQLMDILDMIKQRSFNPVKIFIASRDEPADIRNHYGRGPNIHIRPADVQADIDKFIQESLIRHQRLARFSPSLQENIKHEISRQSEGMFVILHLFQIFFKFKISITPFSVRLTAVPGFYGQVCKCKAFYVQQPLQISKED